MDEIKLLLRNTHDFEAERKFLLSKLENCNGKANEQIKARLDYVNEQLSTIQIWMTLLSEDEAFVTRRHLIEGIDIPRIVVEYGERWGNEFAKRNARSKAISEELFRKSSALSKTNVPFLKISQKNKIGKLFWFDLTLNETGNML